MKSVYMLVKQVVEQRCEVEVEYSRSVTYEGNVTAQKLNEKFLQKRDHFRWRGIGDIAKSAFKLREEFGYLDAEVIYDEVLPKDSIDDHKLCICGDILKGVANPKDCKVFAKACTPQTPLGSCMVSSEGACAAYYKYANM